MGHFSLPSSVQPRLPLSRLRPRPTAPARPRAGCQTPLLAAALHGLGVRRAGVPDLLAKTPGGQKAPPPMMGFSCSVCSLWLVFWRAPLPSQPPSTCPLLQATLSLSQANGPVKECLLDLPLFFTAPQGAVYVSFAPMPRHTGSEPCLFCPRAFTHLATH